MNIVAIIIYYIYINNILYIRPVHRLPYCHRLSNVIIGNNVGTNIAILTMSSILTLIVGLSIAPPLKARAYLREEFVTRDYVIKENIQLLLYFV